MHPLIKTIADYLVVAGQKRPDALILLWSEDGKLVSSNRGWIDIEIPENLEAFHIRSGEGSIGFIPCGQNQIVLSSDSLAVCDLPEGESLSSILREAQLLALEKFHEISEGTTPAESRQALLSHVQSWKEEVGTAYLAGGGIEDDFASFAIFGNSLLLAEVSQGIVAVTSPSDERRFFPGIKIADVAVSLPQR